MYIYIYIGHHLYNPVYIGDYFISQLFQDPYELISSIECRKVF